MIVRIRLASSSEDLLGASSLGIAEAVRLPQIGDPHIHESGAYRVVKVMEDVDPEDGSTERGPIAYVVKVEGPPPASARLGEPRARAAFFVNSLLDLRDCMRRADVARESHSPEEYRRHVEEFIFISKAAASRMGPRSKTLLPIDIPHLPVFHDEESSANLLRHGLIEFGYAAHVESVGSLPALAQLVDRFDPTRPTAFIITTKLVQESGLGALRRIRTHPRTSRCPILILTHQSRDSDATTASNAGATNVCRYPATMEDFSQLIDRIKRLLNTVSPQRTQG